MSLYYVIGSLLVNETGILYPSSYNMIPSLEISETNERKSKLLLDSINVVELLQ